MTYGMPTKKSIPTSKIGSFSITDKITLRSFINDDIKVIKSSNNSFLGIDNELIQKFQFFIDQQDDEIQQLVLKVLKLSNYL